MVSPTQSARPRRQRREKRLSPQIDWCLGFDYHSAMRSQQQTRSAAVGLSALGLHNFAWYFDRRLVLFSNSLSRYASKLCSRRRKPPVCSPRRRRRSQIWRLSIAEIWSGYAQHCTARGTRRFCNSSQRNSFSEPQLLSYENASRMQEKSTKLPGADTLAAGPDILAAILSPQSLARKVSGKAPCGFRRFEDLDCLVTSLTHFSSTP
jgi:hypothetical protein